MNLSDFLGTGWDDPRSAQILGLAQGLMTGGMPGAIEGMQRARDNDLRRQVLQSDMAGRNLANERSQLELTGSRDAIARSKTIRDELAALGDPRPTFAPYGGGAPGAPGAPSMGSVPMLGQVGQQQPAPQQDRPYVPSIAGKASMRPSAPLQAPPGGGPGYAPSPLGAAGPQDQAYGPSPLGTASPADRGYQPSPMGAHGEQTQATTARLIQQAQVYARNGDAETARKLYDTAAKWMPEVHKIEAAMQGGQPVNVLTFKDGRQQISPFAPTPKTHYLDAGGAVLPIDEYTGQQRGAAFPKSMTPGERDASARGWAGHGLARERMVQEQSSPQYMQTEQGIVALPRRPGAGPITAESVTGPTGEPLTAPLKPIPGSAGAAIQTNLQNLSRARTALSLIRGENVGTSAGDQSATGWKGFLPSTLLNRMDPAGVDTRAAIADLGSLVIHDRSGAAVTAAEFPRLAPFIPTPTDDRATAEKKLQRFVQVYEQEVAGLRDTYSREQGYRPNPALERANTPRPAADALPLPAKPTAQSLQRGKAYQLPNGETAVWDGFKFKGQR